MYRLFIDMDGVVADLDGYIDNLLHKTYKQMSYEEKQDWWDNSFTPDIFTKLAPTKHKDKLLDCISKWKYIRAIDTACFLTAVPKRKENQTQETMRMKVKWAKEHFPSIPVCFGPRAQDKQLHCNSRFDILIDDNAQNFADWATAGGTPIFCDNPDKLDECLDRVGSIILK